MRIITILTVIELFLGSITYAQDISFSQFYENPILRNPALAGIFEGDFRCQGTFRNQWQAVSVPYKTGAFSGEMKFPIGNNADWITAGLQITHDVAGDIQLKRTQLMPVVNLHKSLSKDNDNYLSLAFMVGSVNSQFDPTLLKLGDQFDAQAGAYNGNITSQQQFRRTGFTYLDYSTGLSWSSSFEAGTENIARYYVGAGLFHFNRPRVGVFVADESTARLNAKWVLNAGLSLPMSDEHKVVLYTDYFVQGGNRQFLAGALYGFHLVHDYSPTYEGIYRDISLYLGSFYRWNDAIIPTLKLDLYSFGVGLSYDANVSKLKSASQWQGGFEFTLTYKGNMSSRNDGRYLDPNNGGLGSFRGSRHQNSCPSF